MYEPEFLTPEMIMRQELEAEANAAWDDHHERWASSALNPEYEAYCDAMNSREQDGLPIQSMDEWRADCAAAQRVWAEQAERERQERLASYDPELEPPF